jgi:hypothetical protein
MGGEDRLRTFVIGDVHGCLRELDALCERLAPRAGDRFCFLGDLVDRGPDSVGVLGAVRALLDAFPGSVAIAGNHEEKALRRFDKGQLVAPWMHAVSELDRAFLEGLPLWARLPEHGAIAVHGGLFARLFAHVPTLGEPTPDWRRGGGKRGEQLRLILRARMVDAAGRFVGLGQETPDCRHWSADYDGREGFCFFGHDPQLAPPAPLRAPHALGLDTGCCFGGALTAAVLTPGTPAAHAEIVHVPAFARYAEPRAPHGDD